MNDNQDEPIVIVDPITWEQPNTWKPYTPGEYIPQDDAVIFWKYAVGIACIIIGALASVLFILLLMEMT